jgi:ABC-type polysaccharide/polyol phosphate export permease
MREVVAGALLMGYLVAGLFFLRFWRASNDRLFAIFAAAFGLLTVQRIAIILTAETMEDQTVFYLLRLAAFVVIAAGIIDKNRR